MATPLLGENMGLKSFLRQNKVKSEEVGYVASTSFLDENGKPEEFKLKKIDADFDERLREESTRKKQIPGKRGQFTEETDIAKYLNALAVASITYPDLSNTELQDSYQCKCEGDLLRAMLSAGEYAGLIVKVQEVNDFDITMEDLGATAKN